MNFSIRTIALFIALILLMQPIFPYIEFYAFRSYIAKNLCINRNIPGCCCKGKCYLKRRLKETNSSSEQKAPIRSNQTVLDYNLPNKIQRFNYQVSNINIFSFYKASYFFNYSKDFFHPPQNNLSYGNLIFASI